MKFYLVICGVASLFLTSCLSVISTSCKIKVGSYVFEPGKGEEKLDLLSPNHQYYYFYLTLL